MLRLLSKFVTFTQSVGNQSYYKYKLNCSYDDLYLGVTFLGHGSFYDVCIL